LLFDALDRQLTVQSAMPVGYYEILVNLSEAPDGRARMGELAQRTRSSRSRLSHAVDRLEERGWVERGECPTDRRGQTARLTDAGLEALAAAAPGHVDAVREHLIDRLTPQQVTQLEQITTAIIAGIDGAEGVAHLDGLVGRVGRVGRVARATPVDAVDAAGGCDEADPSGDCAE
jgi:DNA-binding MarR family transcriptional regulator